jgi:hypothetical protein
MSLEFNQIITGERIQNLCDIYIGNKPDFDYNPFIQKQTHKHKLFDDCFSIMRGEQQYDNPKMIFCYGHNIETFSKILPLFKNPFILITHNSDQNIFESNEVVKNILNHSKVICWFSQNIGYIHPKLHMLPIGFANSMWEHGNLFKLYPIIINLPSVKTNHIFMNFKIETNYQKRIVCFHSFQNIIPFLPLVSVEENLKRLSYYKYCICPEGNGLDTHRLWECFYLKVIPIVLKNTHTEIIKENYGLPMILLNSWNDLNIENIPDYYSFDFETNYYKLQLSKTENEILQ